MFMLFTVRCVILLLYIMLTRTELSIFLTFLHRSIVNDNGEIKPRSLRFTWSMKTTSSRDPNEIMAEIKKVTLTFTIFKMNKHVKYLQITNYKIFEKLIYDVFKRSWMQTIVITSNGKGSYFFAYMEIQTQTHLFNGKLKSVNYPDCR